MISIRVMELLREFSICESLKEGLFIPENNFYCLSKAIESESAYSAPAGGSPAAGEGQVAHSPDGGQTGIEGDLKLKKVTEFEGGGWYLNRKGGMGGNYYVIYLLPESGLFDGLWWKICE